MGKKELKNRTMVVRLSESELKEIQNFIDFSGIDQSTFMRNCMQKEINDFEKRYEGQEFAAWTVTPKEKAAKRISDIDVKEKRELDDSFFKNATIPDQSLISCGSDVERNPVDMIRIELFTYEELGLPEDHHINWDSPLVGLLIRYLRFCNNNFNLGQQ